MADNDTQYGTPAIVCNATHGVYTVMPNVRPFLNMKDSEANRRTNLLLNLSETKNSNKINTIYQYHAVLLRISGRMGGCVKEELCEPGHAEHNIYLVRIMHS